MNFRKESNPHKDALEYCHSEKRKAMALSEHTSGFMYYNALQAINAWDELVGQLYKPSAVKPKQFEKTKLSALRIVALMKASVYKAETRAKIELLRL